MYVAAGQKSQEWGMSCYITVVKLHFGHTRSKDQDRFGVSIKVADRLNRR